MSDRLFSVRFAAEFVVRRVHLTDQELVVGYRDGWVDRSTVVALAREQILSDDRVSPLFEKLAILLSEDLDDVWTLLAAVPIGDEIESRPVWRYLVLEWLFEHRQEFDDPLEQVELIFADFDFPEEMYGFVRYMPVQEGQSPSTAGVTDRWWTYLCERREHFRTR